MGGFVIKVEGLEKTMQRFLPAKYEPQIQSAFDKFGDRVRTAAIQIAPVDETNLRSSIYFDNIKLGADVGCKVNYAAYLEFGTRRFAQAYVSSLPDDWQKLAVQAKGKGGGSFEEFVLRITEWVRRKGIAITPTKSGNASKSVSAISQQRQAAYVIARSILIKGIKPQPYLYPAVNIASKQLLKDLKEIKL